MYLFAVRAREWAAANLNCLQNHDALDKTHSCIHHTHTHTARIQRDKSVDVDVGVQHCTAQLVLCAVDDASDCG